MSMNPQDGKSGAAHVTQTFSRFVQGICSLGSSLSPTGAVGNHHSVLRQTPTRTALPGAGQPRSS